MTHTQAYAIA